MTTVKPKETDKKKPMCGLVMPISSSPNYPAEHWIEVRAIIEECLEKAGFDYQMVSEAKESGLIHNRIIENLYSNELIVCDVSSKNPNVMFELGIRLSFDKPVVLIVDNETDYTFDAGIMEHLGYVKNLRYASINTFKEQLSSKIIATYNNSKQDNYSPFLKNFKNIIPSSLEDVKASNDQLILRELADMKRMIGASQPKSRRPIETPLTQALLYSIITRIIATKNTKISGFNKLPRTDRSGIILNIVYQLLGAEFATPVLHNLAAGLLDLIENFDDQTDLIKVCSAINVSSLLEGSYFTT